ncbi:MAG: hypothetical protein LQ337_004835, partial [Flavoplaca oasis]
LPHSRRPATLQLSTNTTLPLLFWILNRALDCLDGALARHRGTASELGGFLDLLGDFISPAMEGWEKGSGYG